MLLLDRLDFCLGDSYAISSSATVMTVETNFDRGFSVCLLDFERIGRDRDLEQVVVLGLFNHRWRSLMSPCVDSHYRFGFVNDQMLLL